MSIFGKPLKEYLRFSQGLLIVTAAVGIMRLVLSLLGVPDAAAYPLSLTVLMIFGIGYFPIRVHLAGFGTYRHVLILIVLQLLVAESIVALGIGITAVTGTENIFSAPEFSGGAETHWGHALSHLLGGPTVFALIEWAPASLILLVARRVWTNPRGG